MCDADVKCSIQLELLIAHLLLRIQSVIQEILPAIQFHTDGAFTLAKESRKRSDGGEQEEERREKRGASLGWLNPVIVI